jgi:hypothetical protein
VLTTVAWQPCELAQPWQRRPPLSIDSAPPLRAIIKTTLYIEKTSNNKGANPKQEYQHPFGPGAVIIERRMGQRSVCPFPGPLRHPSMVSWQILLSVMDSKYREEKSQQ